MVIELTSLMCDGEREIDITNCPCSLSLSVINISES